MRNVNKLLLILWMLFPLLATAQVPPPITRSVLTTNIPAFGSAGQALFRISVPPYLNWSNVVASGGLSISDSNNIINLASNYTYAVSNYAYTASNALSGQIVTASNAVLNAASNYTFAVSNLVVASTNGQFIEKTGGIGTNTTIYQVNQTGKALTIGTNAGAVFSLMGVTNGPSPYLVQIGSPMLAANSGGTNMLLGGTNGNWAMAGNLNVVSKISIGNTTPTVPLHILTPAIASTREYIQKSFLSDGGNSCFFVYNGTSADNFFIPSFGGIYDSDSNRVSLQFVGFITAANDVVIPTVPVIRYAAYTASSATDPTTAIFYTIANRNLFAWSGGSGTSGNVDWMTMDARGQLGLNTNVPFARLHVVGAGTNQFVQKWDYTNNLSLATLDTNGVLTVKSNVVAQGGLISTNDFVYQRDQTGSALTIGTNAGAVFSIMGVTNGTSPYLMQIGSPMLAADSGGTNSFLVGTNGNVSIGRGLSSTVGLTVSKSINTDTTYQIGNVQMIAQKYSFSVIVGPSQITNNVYFGNTDVSNVMITITNRGLTLGPPKVSFVNASTQTNFTQANNLMFGIGTNDPQATLHITGGAATNENALRVDTTNNYGLLSLTTNGVLTVKSNLILSSVRWVDSPVQLFWAATGPTVPSAIPVVPGSQILGSGFSVGGIGTEKVYGSFQVNHNVCASNATVYTEHHLHVSPTNAPSAGSSNIAFTIVYDWANVGGTRFGPYTNTVQIGLTSQTYNNLIEFGHQTNFFPGISAMSRCTIYRSAATSNEFNAPVILDGVDVHYPIDRLGSASDTAP